MERILEISYNHNLSHLGSCLTMMPILDEIYNNKKDEDLVVLSAGHAGLAQYVQIEKRYNIDAEMLLEKMGIHPVRDPDNKLYVSSGSLGSAILVCVGLAVANKNRNIYCILSDGECGEGSVWEALAFCQKNKLTNLIIHVKYKWIFCI